jgi:glucose/arabinose dehydrogenase
MQLWSLNRCRAALALLPLVASIAPAQSLPSGFQFQPIVTGGLDNACSMAFAPDGRLFVCERRTGNVRVIHNGSLQAQPWFQIGYTSMQTGESGLLGIAVDPQFLSNRHIYLFYTDPSGAENRIARVSDIGGFGTQFTVLSPNGAMPTSGTRTHNGGRMTFGFDGKLYVSVGDGDNNATPQNVNVWPGKILRFDVPNLTVPSDNPFPGSPVFARGIRNCFGITSHHTLGTIYSSENGYLIGDELNRIVAGGNYGYPQYEGATAPQPFINPIATYTQQPVLTGITSYTGSNYPAGYEGNLFLCHWLDGTVRRIVLSADGTTVLSNTMFADHSNSFDIQLGPDGNLWILHGQSLNGANSVARYVYSATPTPSLSMMAVTGPSSGGSLTLGMTGNNGDLLVPWLGMTLFQPGVPTQWGLIGTPADALLPLQFIAADQRVYQGLALAPAPAFVGLPLHAQALRLDLTTSAHVLTNTATHYVR